MAYQVSPVSVQPERYVARGTARSVPRRRSTSSAQVPRRELAPARLATFRMLAGDMAGGVASGVEGSAPDAAVFATTSHALGHALVACVRARPLAAAWRVCARLTPRIERYPGALVLDLGGSERLLAHLAGSDATARTREAALAAALSRLLLRSDMPAGAALEALCVGVAPSRTAAWLAATYAARDAAWCALGPRDVAAFLAPLPLDALLDVLAVSAGNGASTLPLAVARDVLPALATAGIATVGQLARLPLPSLRRRFGPLGVALATMALGHDLVPLCPDHPTVWLGARLDLAGLAGLAGDTGIDDDHAAMAHALDALADHLAVQLAQRQVAASSIDLALEREEHMPVRGIANIAVAGAPPPAPLVVTRRLGQPLTSAEALRSAAGRLLTRVLLVDEHAASSSFFGGPCSYSRLHLRVGGLRPLLPGQANLWAPRERRQPPRIDRLLAAVEPLARQAGKPILLRASTNHIAAVLPEDRFTLLPLEHSA